MISGMTITASITIPAPARVGSGRANEVMLKQLGAIAIDAARLERLAVDLAHNLKLSPAAAEAAAVLQSGEFSTPPWSSTTLKDVVAWGRAAARLLESSAAVFAAAGGSRFLGTRGDTIAAESPDGTVFPADEEYLTRLAARFDRHLAIGSTLRAGLDYRDERGRSWPLVTIYRSSGDQPSSENQLKLPPEWTRWLSA